MSSNSCRLGVVSSGLKYDENRRFESRTNRRLDLLPNLHLRPLLHARKAKKLKRTPCVLKHDRMPRSNPAISDEVCAAKIGGVPGEANIADFLYLRVQLFHGTSLSLA
jgi:hypothetical protein